jgi:DNA-binding CsgD family transcriptional regulator
MGSAARREREEEGFAGGDDGGDMGDADPEVKEKEEEMGRRMKLMEFNLTRQETEIALLLLKGAKDLNICSLLYISQNTLKYHLRNIYRKTGSSNRRELKNILD